MQALGVDLELVQVLELELRSAKGLELGQGLEQKRVQVCRIWSKSWTHSANGLQRRYLRKKRGFLSFADTRYAIGGKPSQYGAE